MSESSCLYLITGGAGFLGFHTARGVAKRGGKAILYDIAPADLSTYPPGTVYVQGDVRDRAKWSFTPRPHCRLNRQKKFAV
ncbi:MAG: hypothetical protein UX20_C0036G0013 [Candidatus Magasanikbacteria bacterium GW2011_GWC2_45_8]|uniref:Uncharacterized protein n=1 Tax=Candidatus Magasanikbacteria bacterium GW2011_GWC2_45_8 TaxID=1619050 RepID=A0A0G1QWA1_9BACT|nr:MAG: hypothetical protein UX20_C0036G0013 [Candidatus Magasanikbacteria bacterium GW2011_GWC2_45_8]